MNENNLEKESSFQIIEIIKKKGNRTIITTRSSIKVRSSPINNTDECLCSSPSKCDCEVSSIKSSEILNSTSKSDPQILYAKNFQTNVFSVPKVSDWTDANLIKRDSINQGTSKKPTFTEKMLVVLVISFIVLFPVCVFLFYKIIPEYERWMIYRFNKFRQISGPGLVFVVPCIDTWAPYDLRTYFCKIPRQEIVTMDSYKIQVDTVVILSHNVPTNVQIHGFLATIINDFFSNSTVTQIVQNRASYVEHVENKLTDACRISNWDVKIQRVEITNLIFHVDNKECSRYKNC